MEALFTLDCGEIYLQEFRAEDIDAMWELFEQPEVYEFLPDWRQPKERRLFFLTQYEIPSNKGFLASRPAIQGLDRLYSMLNLAIIHKETGKMIGFVNTGIKEELGAREISYGISRDYRNHGYASQAVGALLRFLFTETDLEVIHAIALIRNPASNRVIEKSGFTYQGEMEIDNEPYHRYLLTKRDWQTMNP